MYFIEGAMKSSVLGALQHLLDLILILILRCVVIFSISQMRKVRLMELKLIAFQFTVVELTDFSLAIGEVWL